MKAEIRKYLDERKAWYFMPQTGGYGRSGIPDFVGCYLGKFFGIEAKKLGHTADTTVLQDRELVGIHLAGGRAVVADGVSQVEEMFANIDMELIKEAIA